MRITINHLFQVFLLAFLLSIFSNVKGQSSDYPWQVIPVWSPDGGQIAVANGSTGEIWDASSGERLILLQGHTDQITDFAWNSDGSIIATSSLDHHVKLWNSQTGQLIQSLPDHEDYVLTVTWVPQETKLISTVFDHSPTLFVWDVGGSSPILEGRYIAGTANNVVFSPDRQKLVSITRLSAFILDATTYQRLARSTETMCCTNVMETVSWSPDSARLVTGTNHGLVTVWDAASLKIMSQFAVNQYAGQDGREVVDLNLSWVRSVAFSPNSSQVFSASGDGTLGVWDALTGEALQSQTIAPFDAAAWSPYGARLVYLNVAPADSAMLRHGSLNDLKIVVPFASLERLQAIQAQCEGTAQRTVTLEAPSTTTALPAYIARVEALPTAAIPPACRADLLAVAGALLAGE